MDTPVGTRSLALGHAEGQPYVWTYDMRIGVDECDYSAKAGLIAFEYRF